MIGVGVALAATILPAPLAAQTAELSQRDRFELDTGCAVGLAVEGFDGGEIGLTESQITTAVRSRLRAARIYDPDSADHLYVNLNVLGGTAAPYSFRIELKKWLYDLRDPSAGDGGGMGFAGTWRSSEVGYGDASYILAAVGRHMDEFIDEYLRVNECDGTGEASP